MCSAGSRAPKYHIGLLVAGAGAVQCAVESECGAARQRQRGKPGVSVCMTREQRARQLHSHSYTVRRLADTPAT